MAGGGQAGPEEGAHRAGMQQADPHGSRPSNANSRTSGSSESTCTGAAKKLDAPPDPYGLALAISIVGNARQKRGLDERYGGKR